MNIIECQLFTRFIRSRREVGCIFYDINQALGVSLQASQLSELLKFPSCALGALWWHLMVPSLAVIPERLWSLGHHDICLHITPPLLVAATRPYSYPPHNIHTYFWGAALPHSMVFWWSCSSQDSSPDHGVDTGPKWAIRISSWGIWILSWDKYRESSHSSTP